MVFRAAVLTDADDRGSISTVNAAQVLLAQTASVWILRTRDYDLWIVVRHRKCVSGVRRSRFLTALESHMHQA
jgi:hypothetical protein